MVSYEVIEIREATGEAEMMRVAREEANSSMAMLVYVLLAIVGFFACCLLWWIAR